MTIIPHARTSRFAHLFGGRTVRAAPLAAAGAAASTKSASREGASTAAHARTVAVLSSEQSHGRERLAADMLGTSMSATEIIGLLAKSPKAAKTADRMLARIQADPAPKLGAGHEAGDGSRERADAFWARVRAANPARR